jgi:ubiquilin
VEDKIFSFKKNFLKLKEEVSKKFNKSIDQLCLIYAGKILKDVDTLTQHGIKDGVTVHLVIKAKPSEPPASNTTTTQETMSNTQTQQTSQTQAPASSQGANLFGLPFGQNLMNSLGSMGFTNSNFAEVQHQMQQQIMSNPETLRQMLDNPMVQSLMTNPDIIRDLMMSNPQMQDLMERNPEIQHMLNNPTLLRETMELARNPAALQELMRHHDRALTNLENIPGGFSALQRLYRDVEEPMMNAARDSFGRNPFSGLFGNNAANGSSGGTGGGDTSNRQAGTENTEPLPNPWAPRSSTATPSSATTTTTATTSSTSSATSGSTATTGSTQQVPSGNGLWNSPGMQSYLQQITQNPRLLESMMSTPYMQSMIQMLSTNPELARQMIENNPMLGQNQDMRDSMSRALPNLLSQLQNPEMQSLLTNPDALQAVLQIQEGMQRLQTAAPNMLGGLGYPNLPFTPPSQTTGGANPLSTNTSQSPGPAQQTTTPTSSSSSQQNPSNYFTQMLNMMANNTIVSLKIHFFFKRKNQKSIFSFSFNYRVNLLNKDLQHNLNN